MGGGRRAPNKREVGSEGGGHQIRERRGWVALNEWEREVRGTRWEKNVGGGGRGALTRRTVSYEIFAFLRSFLISAYYKEAANSSL